MKKNLLFFILLCTSQVLFAQEWETPIEGMWFLKDVIPVEGRQCALGVGEIEETAYLMDGFIIKIKHDGDYISRRVHAPGMTFQYHSAVQLPNGNFMAFGICDDSLCDPDYQKYLRVDVFDGDLECVSSKMYSVDDDVFDCFYLSSYFGEMMKSVVTKNGTVVLAARPSYYYVNPGLYSCYKPVIRFYEFDENGNILKVGDNPLTESVVGAIKEVTYEPHSDNLMAFVDGGWFGNASGVSGILVVDTALQIVARQSLLQLGSAEYVSDNACEGRWIDGNRLIIDLERHIGASFAYHSLHKVDSALNLYASLRLPPYDSTSWASLGTSTAYVDDSTIFAITYCKKYINGTEPYFTNVILVDKDLNFLGRKVLKAEGTTIVAGQPVAFADGGCLVPIYTQNGEDCYYYSLMKFRREDIEITWDVIEEKESNRHTQAYPNPTRGTINIPIGEAACIGGRLQVFDMKGEKCLDCAITKQGNLITLDVQNLEAGMYVYKVVLRNQETISGKFVKE